MRHKSIPRDTHELAWAAGFFDGEGCTCINRHKPKNQNKIAVIFTISISQTNPEPLERFRDAVDGLGVIGGPYSPPSFGTGKKPQWKYTSTGLDRGEKIMALLWPWLGTQKRDQAMAAMVVARANQRKPGRPTKEYCKRGHDLGVVGRNVRGSDRRICRECERRYGLAAYYKRIGDLEEAQRVLDGTHVSRKGFRRKDRPVVIT